MCYKGEPVGAKPLLVGRGAGTGDVPGLKMIGDVDPSDVAQGGVGDCWLLSAISALAEFDGAVHKLFAATPQLGEMPRGTSNSYTVTLYELSTWQPVEVTVDERLCSSDGNMLLGAQPSLDGELWVCYLEKAVAAHCGGWDKIDGGQCTHAWALLTGCKDQYTIKQEEDGRYGCWGNLNPNTGAQEEMRNSPHDGFKGCWPMAWPAVGGGGALGLKLSKDEVFERMCQWDDSNFILGCGTTPGSDSKSTDGIVDGHAYTVLTCVNNAGGTDFDLIKVRNPWGKGEFQSGMWDDDGPGWTEYPEVKRALKPVAADDGVFWVSKDEFFKYFPVLFLCAKDMIEFLRK